ncbi:type IV secretion system protein VirJ [Sphingomonas sp. JC676]|uniref:AcvB/VirJ family lysyl-phosphatidylglycerol hydrolase n=1 Tax=Sphingomonas sp. JC676 TaxID=2768065 RepID=UPI0016576C31|nr:AcvB/VirJ family lysyl-phosphatidylglycerol hydrolase [Sphingomonas sp. JC676]MBC9031319.1 type IV secretion system protein VirJ [Sphingomonas sp. JC676]
MIRNAQAPRRLRILPRGWKGRTALVVAFLAGAILILYAVAGFFDRDPVHLFGMEDGSKPVAAVYFSGDMGLRFGMGPYVAGALAKAGVPVLGVSSSTAFARHRSREEVDAIVANAIRDTLMRTGAEKIIVLGQSFGADMVRVGLVSLPADLRARVVAVVLVVPGETAYFRADPTNIAYTGTPDADASSARKLDWVPLTCIWGKAETDSLCPLLLSPNVRRIPLPGGHFLQNDHDLLVRTIFASLGTLIPAPMEPSQ